MCTCMCVYVYVCMCAHVYVYKFISRQSLMPESNIQKLSKIAQSKLHTAYAAYIHGEQQGKKEKVYQECWSIKACIACIGDGGGGACRVV